MQKYKYCIVSTCNLNPWARLCA